jgi:glycosyltransferase involved in cell wall biosynthesis
VQRGRNVLKIVVAYSYSPYPVRRGIHRLIVNLLEGLTVRHEVTLVSMTVDRAEEEALGKIARGKLHIRSMRAPNRRSNIHRALYKFLNRIRASRMAVPMETLYAAPAAYLDLVRDTAHEERADLVIAFYWHLFDLPIRLEGIECVLATQDIDFLVHPLRLKYAADGVDKRALRREAARKERTEREAYNRYGTILTVTERDAAAVRELYGRDGKRVYTLPLAIDLDRFSPGAFERKANTLLMLGAFDADFNRDACEWFVRAVFPLVLRSRPETVLEIAGVGLSTHDFSGFGDAVRFLGRVDDIRPYLGACSLMMLPLRFGGGVRIRMMEAAAMGTPVVSTSVGVAGMGLADGRECIIADSPQGMAHAVLLLLEEPHRARKVGENARAWAERTIAMTDYPERLETLLREIRRGT